MMHGIHKGKRVLVTDMFVGMTGILWMRINGNGYAEELVEAREVELVVVSVLEEIVAKFRDNSEDETFKEAA